MAYTNITKPVLTTYTAVKRDVVNYPQYGTAVYGTSKYGITNTYSSVNKPVTTTYTQIAKPII